jgi:prophage antirepressor-like protein
MTSIYDLLFRTFKYDDREILVLLDIKGIIWFRAKEVAHILKYSKTKEAVRTNVEKEDRVKIKKLKLKIKPNGIANNTVFINEYGFYCLVFGSRLKEAKKFRKWVTREILPTIRKTGMYIANERLQNKLKQLNELMKEKNEYIESLEYNQKYDKYKNGGTIYIAQLPDIKKYVKKLYKVGKTINMNKRKHTYNSATPNNIKLLYTINVNNPTAIEYCIKSILYPYVYRKNKEYYSCSLKFIMKAIKSCVKFTGDKQYKCYDCNKLTNETTSILNHMENNHHIDLNKIGGYYVSFEKN